MKNLHLASAIALALGSADSIQAATISITQMDFGAIYAATGTMNSAGTGVMQSVDPFFYQPWTATQQSWFDTHNTPLTWSGGSTYSTYFVYTFTLTGNQVAAGTYFDWSVSSIVPVLTIYDCPVSGGGACTGSSLPMITSPFPGQQPGFNGTTADDFPVSGVPVPAAAWLMGSGLLGLVSVARSKTRTKSRFDGG